MKNTLKILAITVMASAAFFIGRLTQTDPVMGADPTPAVVPVVAESTVAPTPAPVTEPAIAGGSGHRSEPAQPAQTVVVGEPSPATTFGLPPEEELEANQDPMNPMEDREFIAQMAQFSSLEQMANMSRTMERMAEANKFSAVSYVGKTVGFTKEAETPGGKPKQVVAAVKAVWFDDPKQGPVLETTEGFVPLSKIEGVGPEYKVKAKS